MKAWVVEAISDPGAMRLAEVPMPEPGEGQVLLRVEAAGLNFLDALMLRGAYQVKPPLPFTPGVECVGTVVACGPGATLAVGTRVCADMQSGAYAEYVVAAETSAVPIAGDVPAGEALALFSIVYPTSYHGLIDRGGLRRGETVLVHAGAGGVGSAAIQIAVAHGARVIATAGGAEKVATCRRLGAELAIDYNTEDWVKLVRGFDGGRGMDVIYDPVGGAVGEQSLRCLAWLGRYLVIGFAGGGIPMIPANRLLLKSASAVGVYWGDMRSRDPALARRVQEALLDLYRNGAIAPLIGGRFRLAEAERALADLSSRRSVGKLVLLAE